MNYSDCDETGDFTRDFIDEHLRKHEYAHRKKLDDIDKEFLRYNHMRYRIYDIRDLVKEMTDDETDLTKINSEFEELLNDIREFREFLKKYSPVITKERCIFL